MNRDAHPRTPIRVGIVDDHPYLREGVRAMLQGDSEIEIVGEASDADGAFELVKNSTPDVLLLDIRMPGKSGIRAAHELHEQYPELKIIVLTAYDKPEYVRSAQNAQASAYVVKTNGNLVPTIHAVAAGLSVMPSDVSLGPAPWEVLTATQLKVARLVATNHGDKESACKLGISTRTIEKHRQDMRDRLRRLTPPISADPLTLARWLADWGEIDET